MSNFLLTQRLSELEFCALDIETTGLCPTKDEILEIGAIRFQRSGKILEFQTLLKPSKLIPKETIKIHGIKNETVKNSPSIQEILPSFLSFIQDSILVIQNSVFDLSFLIHYAKMAQLPFPTLPVFCTLQLTRKYYPNLQRYKLSYLKEYFHIETYKTRTPKESSEHEALNDAFIAMNVFKICLTEKNFWQKKFHEVAYHQKGLQFTIDYDTYLF